MAQAIYDVKIMSYGRVYVLIPTLYARARAYKTFSMLNSAEHEILNAHKYKNIIKFSFLGSDKTSVMYKTIFVINIILHMCLQHSNTL